MTFGKVPHPAFQDRPIYKPEGIGWNNLGQRTVRGVVLHRMIGTLWGTDTWFRNPTVPALTDYGIGVAATDGAGQDGVILRWNDPLGTRAGWASGPVNGAYGDGLRFLNKYGIHAVNRDQVSLEISGNYETPVTEHVLNQIAALVAYWADQYKITWKDFPNGPEGFSFVRWHQEFTLGSGKVCPGDVIIKATTVIIEKARAIMKQYQEEAVVQPTPATFGKASKFPTFNGKDHMLNSVKFWVCEREITVKGPTKCHVSANPKSALTRGDLEATDTFESIYVVRGDDQKFWYVTKNGTRIPQTNCSPKITFTT